MECSTTTVNYKRNIFHLWHCYICKHSTYQTIFVCFTSTWCDLFFFFFCFFLSTLFQESQSFCRHMLAMRRCEIVSCLMLSINFSTKSLFVNYVNYVYIRLIAEWSTHEESFLFVWPEQPMTLASKS